MKMWAWVWEQEIMTMKYIITFVPLPDEAKNYILKDVQVNWVFQGTVVAFLGFKLQFWFQYSSIMDLNQTLV